MLIKTDAICEDYVIFTGKSLFRVGFEVSISI